MQICIERSKRRSHHWSGLLLAGALAFAASGAGAESLSSAGPGGGLAFSTKRNADYEGLLLSSLQSLNHLKLDRALDQMENLVRQKPGFKLAQLIYGDMLLARTQPLTTFGSLANADGDLLAGLREEARQRWEHFQQPPPAKAIPRNLIQLSPRHHHALVVELDRARLYLYDTRAEVPRKIASHYISFGKQGMGKLREGDKKTPLGVYDLTRYIPPNKLPDFYGSGAFPIDYPNTWDKRHGRTGYGIWVHGTPLGTYSRPPRASDGCIAVSNDDLEALKPYLTTRNTPVIIADSLDWITVEQWQAQRAEFQRVLDDWRLAWSSRDSERYLAHYSQEFHNGKHDFTTWSRHKRAVNASKHFIKVKLDDVSVFEYPGEEGLLVVDFKQDYRSDNYHHTGRKRQYWKHHQRDGWKIVYEGPV